MKKYLPTWYRYGREDRNESCQPRENHRRHLRYVVVGDWKSGFRITEEVSWTSFSSLSAFFCTFRSMILSNTDRLTSSALGRLNLGNARLRRENSVGSRVTARARARAVKTIRHAPLVRTAFRGAVRRQRKNDGWRRRKGRVEILYAFCDSHLRGDGTKVIATSNCIA